MLATIFVLRLSPSLSIGDYPSRLVAHLPDALRAYAYAPPDFAQAVTASAKISDHEHVPVPIRPQIFMGLAARPFWAVLRPTHLASP